MCIRDRPGVAARSQIQFLGLGTRGLEPYPVHGLVGGEVHGCLLYTSDAADERSSVDLGGRRILKKKNQTGNNATSRDC